MPSQIWTVLFSIFISTSSFAATADVSKVFFVTPKNGASVKNPVKIKFGVKGKKVRPAGEDPNDKNSGHHHLIINATPVAEGQTITTDASHIHFGKGQTETEITLPLGKHKLTLQFADGAHRSYGEAMSATIEVTVK